MQLNKTNGDIVIINKGDKQTGRTVFSEYENVVYNTDSSIYAKFAIEEQQVKILNLDYSDLADNTKTIEDNIDLSILNSLKTELGVEWSVSNDIQNWLHTDKPFRVLINNVENNREILVNPDYKTLMNDMLVLHDGFIDVNNINTVMYVNTLEDSDLSIIAGFINTPENPDGWIYSESKIN